MATRLALHGGTPVRENMLPYCRHLIDEDDIAAVTAVLRSDWLTTGPYVARLERAFASHSGMKEGVAVSSGTAALHAAMHALGIVPGDEVIVPALTFPATANGVVYQGGTPVFADVDPDTLLINPVDVEAKLSSRTKAIIAVDYAGQPCDYDTLGRVASRHQLALVSDACHSLGATYKGRPVGSLASLNVFSLHPAKHITTGEGGIVTTNDSLLGERMRVFRNHGISADHCQRHLRNTWFYEMTELGFNYRLTDFQCALGLSQLAKQAVWVERRRTIASRYDEAFAPNPAVNPLVKRPEVEHAYHLYVVRLRKDALQTDRATIFQALRAEGIGVNVHYIPVHLHPLYQERFATGHGSCPVAEHAYEQILTLPIFPMMSDADIDDVVTSVFKVLKAFQS